MGTLSHVKARKVYDRIGSIQDSQGFYEDEATSLLIENGRFDEAESVFEFGCGTGRFALRLFQNVLSQTAVYRGRDISPEMIRLATERLAPYSERATVVLSEGGPPVSEPGDEYDRFVSNYVFDLLSAEDLSLELKEARRMLKKGGLLCLSGLSTGSGIVAGITGGALGLIHKFTPGLIGGCRPVDLVPFIDESRWKIEFHEKITAYGITSEALVAGRL